MGPSSLEAADDPGVGVDRDEARGRRRPPARATTAAASAALPQLAMARSGRSAGLGQPEPFRHLEVQQHAHEMAPFVGPGDIAGLVLDPHPAGRAEARADRTSSSLRANGVAEEPWPSTSATAAVEAGDERDELLVAHPAGDGAVVAVQQAAVASERARRPLPAPGKRTRDGVQDPHEHVVDVADAGVGAPERVRRRPSPARRRTRHSHARTAGSLRSGHAHAARGLAALTGRRPRPCAR